MTNEVRKQILKALAYGKGEEEIKECTGVSDEDINSITQDEVDKEKIYYKEMGYLK